MNPPIFLFAPSVARRKLVLGITEADNWGSGRENIPWTYKNTHILIQTNFFLKKNLPKNRKLITNCFFHFYSGFNYQFRTNPTNLQTNSG